MLTASWRRLLFTCLAVAAVAIIVTWQWPTIVRSFDVLGTANLGWLALAAAAEAGSLVAFGISRRTLLRANGGRIRLRTVMAVTYASQALSQSIPFAGAELAVVYSYRQFRRFGLDAPTTSWALTVSWMCSTASLALLLLSGAIANPAATGTALGFAGAALYLLPPAAVLLALRFTRVRRVLHRVLAWVASGLKRMFGKPERGADGLEEFLDEVSRTTLPASQYALAFVTAIGNFALDCAALALSIAAMGQPVPWGSLLLVYGAGVTAGSTGLTPGGFLLVELTMSAALTASGVPGAKAIAAVLAYRVVNFWLVLLGGWLTMAVLTHPAFFRVPASVRGRVPGRIFRVPGRLRAPGSSRRTDPPSGSG